MYNIAKFRIQLIKDSSFPSDTKTIGSPHDAAKLIEAYLAGADRENLVVLLLNTKNTVIGINTVSIGTLNQALVCGREVFKPAIVGNAAAIILGHNHPSGNPIPSPDDIYLTKELVKAGRMLGIDVLDHIIIGDGTRCYSMKERGDLDRRQTNDN